MLFITKNFANGFFYENLSTREYITIILNGIETILIFEIQAHFSCFGPIPICIGYYEFHIWQLPVGHNLICAHQFAEVN